MQALALYQGTGKGLKKNSLEDKKKKKSPSRARDKDKICAQQNGSLE